MVVLLEGSPISTEEPCQSDHRVLGHLPDQGPSPLIAQSGWAASSRKSIGGYKLLPFKNDGGHCVHGDLQRCKKVDTLPQICALKQSCLGDLRTIPLTSWLGFCSGGLLSSCKNIKDDQWKQDAPEVN